MNPTKGPTLGAPRTSSLLGILRFLKLSNTVRQPLSHICFGSSLTYGENVK